MPFRKHHAVAAAGVFVAVASAQTAASQVDVGGPGTDGPAALIVEPQIGAAFGSNRAKGNYRSTGSQPPFDGDDVHSPYAALGAGLDLLVPLSMLFGDDPLARATAGRALTVAGPLIGFGLRYDLLSEDDKVVVNIVRHRTSGRVQLIEREAANVGLYAMAGVPISLRSPRLATFLYGGAGWTFTKTRITLSSDKTPREAPFTRTSKTRWDTGLGVIGGIRAALCRACAFGSRLNLGFEWQGRWMPDRNVATPSQSLGILESGRVHDRFAQQFKVTLSIPFSIPLR